MKTFRIWLVLSALVVASGIVVPYGLLAGGPPGFDIFLFWCLFGVAVVALIVVGVTGWRD